MGSLTACQSGQSSEETPSELPENQRIYLKDASSEQMAPYIVEDNVGNELLVVCQVKPDSDLYQKTAMIGVQVVKSYQNKRAEGGESQKVRYVDEDQFEEGDYLGICDYYEVDDDLIFLDDPVFDTDIYVCEDLMGDDLYDCLLEHDQNITVEL